MRPKPADHHDAILRDWKENAAGQDDSNFRFLRSLKMVPNPERIDRLAAGLHEEAFERIDCTRCAHCCKTMRPAVSTADIQRIAAHLTLTRKAFIETYLASNEDETGYRMNAAPCPFLGADDHCTIYEVRPRTCREFPHTDKKDFTSRTYLHAGNAQNCPAVYYIVKKMRQLLRR
jgi:Fe-S-cluster containining protein